MSDADRRVVTVCIPVDEERLALPEVFYYHISFCENWVFRRENCDKIGFCQYRIGISRNDLASAEKLWDGNYGGITLADFILKMFPILGDHCGS